MIFHANCACRRFSWNNMPYLFLKKQQNLKLSSAAICRWRFMINFLPTNVVCWLLLQNLEGATDPFCIKWPLAKGSTSCKSANIGQCLISIWNHMKMTTENFVDLTLLSVQNLDPKCLIMDDLFLQPVNNFFSHVQMGLPLLNKYQAVSG